MSVFSLVRRCTTSWKPLISKLLEPTKEWSLASCNPNPVVVFWGTPPDSLGSLRSILWVACSSFYSLKPRRVTGVQGASPCNPNPVVVFSIENSTAVQGTSVSYKKKQIVPVCFAEAIGHPKLATGLRTCS
ncbi:hypothetical protein TRICI_005396 [Trichomonascus ciferrii]|uniref:Uncharacterized protein n=1 Tax=Trichomonascus ciferrii TaxID=44093 RepID=A0A642USL0_9ASCO|nr:hypothetical protein TRICI_005396 [Trichomonascus ciferrii]